MSKRKMKSILFISMILLIFLTISCVSAQDTLDIVSDEVGNLSTSDSDVLELSADDEILKVGEGNSFADFVANIQGKAEYTLDRDYTYDTSADGDTLKEGIPINADLRIIGNGKTINGNNLARIFIIENGAKLSLEKVNLINGSSNQGAAVYVGTGTLTADEVFFENNSALDNGGAIYNDGGVITLNKCVLNNNDVVNLEASASENKGGAAIYAKDASVTLVNTNVTNNGRSSLDRSNGDMINGVINLLNSSAAITGGLFENNTGIYGGAICSDGDGSTTLTVNDATFNNNKAYNGGAIDITDLVTNISNCEFNDNWVIGPGSTGFYGIGGAIAASGTGSFTLTKSNFTGNHADGVNATAGAVHVGLDNNCLATIDDCKFENNAAVLKGGAVFANSYNLTISGSTFADGNTAGMGNAIYNGGSLTLSGNTVNSDDAEIYSAGILISGAKAVVSVDYINHCLSDNVDVKATLTDDNGNKIFVPVFEFKFNGSTKTSLYDDSTGFYSFIFNANSYTSWPTGITIVSVATPFVPEIESAEINYFRTFTDLEYDVAHVKTSGYNAYTLNLKGDYTFNPAFDRDELKEGIKITHDMTISGNKVIDGSNQARIFNVTEGITLTLNNPTIVNGSADKGGAIYVESGATLKNGASAKNIFANNSATNGGAIYSEGTVILNNALFENNSALDNGGAIYNDGGVITLNKCVLNNNDVVNLEDSSSENKGGAILINDGLVKLSDSVFKDNVANGNKNSIYLASGELYLENNTINSEYAEIVNANGLITSLINVVVMENKTISTELLDLVALNATVKDDHDNLIYDESFNFTVDENNVKTTPGFNLYTGEYVIRHIGKTEVSMNSNNEHVNVEIGIFEVPKYDTQLVIDNIITNPDNNKTLITVNITDKDGKKVLVEGNVTITIENESGIVKTVISDNFYDTDVTVDLGILAPGEYNITAVYNGDDTYANSTNDTESHIVPLVTNKDLPITVYDITYNESDVYIDVELPDGCDEEYVLIDVNGTIYDADYFEQFGNQVILTLSNLAAGEYCVTVILEDNVYCLENTTSFKVLKADPKFNITAADVVYGSDVNVVPDYAANAGEVNYTIFDNNEKVVATGIKDISENFTANLPVGTYSVVAQYSNANYTDVTVFTTVNVKKADSDVHIDVSPEIDYGDNATVSVSINETATGNIIFYVDGVKYAETVNDFNITDLAAGSHSIMVIYDADNNFTQYSANFTVKVNKIAPVMNITDDTVKYLENADFTIKTNVPGYYILIINGTVVGIIKVDKTYEIEVPTNLLPGTYDVNITVDETENHTAGMASGTLTVNPGETVIDLTAKNVTYGSAVNIVPTIPQGATGELTYTVVNSKGETVRTGSKSINEVFVVDDLAAGEYTVSATYSGDDLYGEVTVNSVKFNVSKAIPEFDASALDVVYGNDIQIIPTSNVPNGQVNYTVTKDGVTVANGIKDISEDFTAGLPAGKYTVNATYVGNENYTASTVIFDVNVMKANSSIGIAVNEIYNAGEGIVITLTPVNSTGEITVTINGEEYSVKDNKVTIDDGLTADSYTIVADLAGDDNYESSTATASFEVIKQSSDISIDVEDVYSVDDDIVIALTPVNSTGAISVTINGKQYSVEDDKVTIPKGLVNGTYFVVAKLDGDDKYLESESDATFKVNKVVPTDVKAQDLTFVVDNEGILDISGPDDRTGNLIVNVGGKDYSVKLTGGKANLDVSSLPIGEYDVSITYMENDKYLETEFNNVAKVTIENKSDADMKVDVENATITVELPDDATGTVTVVVDGKEYNVSDASKSPIVIDISDLAPGDYNVEVIYSGDDKYNTTSETEEVTVPKIDDYSIKVTSNNITYGQTESIEIEVDADIDGVIVDVNGIKYYVELTDGKGSVDVKDLDIDDYVATVTYPGNDKYDSKSNTTKFSVKPMSDAGMKVDVENGTLIVELPEDVTGTVTVVVDGKEYNVSDASKSPIVIDISDLAPGDYNFEVIYSGDDKYYADCEIEEVTIPKQDNYPLKVDTKVDGDKASINVELPEDIDGVVLVDVDDKQYYIDVKNGKGTLELDDLKNGNHEVSVKYPGDDKYAPAENTTEFNTSGHKESPLVEINASDIKVGDDLIVDVNVPKDTTGKVILDINGKTYFTPVKDGKASFNISDLKYGDYPVEAIYEGDDKYLPAGDSTTVRVSKVEDYPLNVSVNGNDIVVTLPEDAKGNVSVDVDGRKLTGEIENGVAIIYDDNMTPGKHNITVTFGDDKYANKNSSSVIDVENIIHIIAPQLEKYYSGSERFEISVVDMIYNGVSNITLSITVNGMTYTRVTDENGTTSLAINLQSGEYPIYVKFAGNDQFDADEVESKVTIIPTIYADDVFKVFRNATQYHALFLDGEGNPLVNTDVTFNIHGVFYTRTTNASGWAQLNINIESGKYIITASNTVTGEMKANNITVFTCIVENYDIVKYYRNATQFSARIVGDNGSYVGAGEKVTFNINGVFYTRTTDENGYVRLNINLQPGDYIITTYYKDCVEANKIKVLPVLLTDDLNMHYDDGSQFVAKLLDGQGNPYPNQVISFNVNGILYNRTTDDTGYVRLNINLQSGEYIITSTYNEYSISNKITIS